MNDELSAADGSQARQQTGSPAVSSTSMIVVKVGGSLLDMPDLADRLRGFLESLRTPRLILVVGGGPAADLVRQRDRDENFDDDKSHWLAVRAMSFNSFLVEALVSQSIVVSSVAQCRVAWSDGHIPILDPHTFLVADEASGAAALPHRWTVTSDTIAARIARVSSADELVLLKSVSWPVDASLSAAAEQGIVDEHLPRELRRSPQLRVRIENLRS
jgi:5-(aminomethyl)-3-furanmethanol phosphate kinase